jgi:hypothetical protein
VGRARATEAPASPFAGLREAVKLIGEVDQLRETLGLGGGGGGAEEDDKPSVPEPAEKPFEVMEVPGGIKWPHGKGLSRVDQLQQFAMLNPDITTKALGQLSQILDRSIVGQFAQYMMQRGNAQQQAAAAGFVQAPPGVGRPASQPPPAPAMPPVVRAPAMVAPPNGTPSPDGFPVAPNGGWQVPS